MNGPLLLDVEAVSKHFFLKEDRRPKLRLSLFCRGSTSPLTVLRSVSFQLRRGDRVALLGRNGSGKTTLLRIIAGIYLPDKGKVRVAEHPCLVLNSAAGFVPTLSIIDNIRLQAGIHFPISSFDRRVIEEAIAEARLSTRHFQACGTLSIGERQRLTMALCKSMHPAFLLLDETFANLDRQFQSKCRDWLGSLVQRNASWIMTSHDESLIREFCSMAVWIENGMIKAQGQVDDVLKLYSSAQS